MRRIACLLLCIGTIGLLYGCASTKSQEYVRASVYGLNYSEDYVWDFSILTESGEQTGMGGSRVQEFSKGGLSGLECCASIPRAGRTVIVEWEAGDRKEADVNWKSFRKKVVVRGEDSSDPDKLNSLVIRFFPGHEVEAELICESTGSDARPSPRRDQLFYGSSVMRQMGE
ncbi:hypothetical protein BTO02_05380 [Paraburkholderia sp. SOS3]|nr:hypothetical protein BTO02_05380 [Paraburkholderia sp. SOS3]